MNIEKIRISAGLIKYEPGWHTLLDQIGLPWETIKNLSGINPSSYSLIIVNKVPDQHEKEILDLYLLIGGSILTEFMSGSSFIKKNFTRKKINSITPDSDLFNPYDLLDIFNISMINKNELITLSGNENCGTIAHIPFPVNEIFTKIISRRKNFYFTSKRLPNEVVRLQSLGAVRRLIFSVVEYLHHCRGIPFVHTWFYPRDYPSVFTFRIDTDKGSREEIDELYRLLERFDIPASWFLDVKSHGQWIDYFKKFNRQELGIHCYEHQSYKSYAANFDNLLKAADILKKNNLRYIGFAAPLGRWNYSINEAAEKLGFAYSSEFGFDYDNLPLYPWISERFSPILQLPVHPICAGSMRRAHFSKEQMPGYFLSYIQKQIDLREPVCLYHHPTHHFNDVFESVFGYINRQNILKISYSGFAAWWKKRLSVKPQLIWNFMGKKLHAEIPGTDNDVWFRISMPENKELITALNSGEFSAASFNPTENKKMHKTPADLKRMRKFDWRHFIYNILDYWYSRKQ